jgi:hypothetical protein
MVIEENPPLRDAAKALGEKLDAFFAKATRILKRLSNDRYFVLDARGAL